MFAFFNTSKSSPLSRTKDEGLSGSSVGREDNLKDTLVDPLVQQEAQQSSTQSPSQNTKKNDQPGLLHKLFRTKKWKAYEANKKAEEQKLKMEKATQMAKALSNEQIFNQCWDILYKFAASEFNAENMDFIQEVNRGGNPEEIYRTFVDKSGDKMINLAGPIRRPLDELAKKGQYSQMDFGKAKDAAGGNISDVIYRFRESKMFVEELARGL